jgi:hypothetical protein
LYLSPLHEGWPSHRIRPAADQSQRPSIDHDNTVSHLTEGDVPARAHLLDAPIEADVAVLDIAQRARHRVDPQRAVDVDAIAPMVSRGESKSDLAGATTLGVDDPKAVAGGESLVE